MTFCFHTSLRIGLLLFLNGVMFTCRGILFDMDGVLVDSTAAVARVWRRWALEHGLDPERVIGEAHGRRSIETVRAVASHLPAERENTRVEIMEIEDRDGVRVLPGAASLLRKLAANCFSIVTSATRALAVARMEHAGLRVPMRFVSADDVAQGKPWPEPYLKGAALLKMAPQDCLVFEDTPAGIESAQKAGMRVIALHTTYPVRELMAADAVVASLADVEAQVKDEVITLTVTPLAST